MTENRKTPKLRFKGFTDAWEQRKLSEVLSSYTDPVEIPRTGYERLGIRSHAKGTFHNFVPAGHELQTAQMHRVAADKFIVNITFGWEHAVAVTDENDAGKLVSHRFPQFSLSEELDPKFLKFIILDEDFRHHLWLASPGGAGRNRVLNINEMLQYEIMIPNVPEQRKIARMLIDLDNLITLHQRKLDRLKNIKKSMLDKMFPKDGEVVPEIRFKGFTDAWEQRKVSDIGEVITGFTPSTQHSEYYSEDGIPWVTPTDIVDNIIHDTPRKLSPLGEKVGRVVPANTILVTCIASIGKNTMLANMGSFNQQINGLVPYNKKYDPYFLLTESFHWSSKMKREASAGTMQIVNKNEFSAIDTYVPEWDEQKAIGNYFRQLDNLITLHQRKLDKLKNIKKSMLDNMFV